MYKNGKLVLVGAGPGDEELITLKGVKALSQARVVLYDALVNQALLNHAPEDAPRIFVGKRGGMQKCNQQEINELIVRCALQYGNVVRLKGGDPCVFGRSQEEIEYAERFGIETEIIPGVTSAISVPALQKIPITVRGVAESFWVITGVTKDHKLSDDVRIAAQSSATIVILMGMRNLKEIAEIFISIGKKDVPVAIIQNGSTPNEQLAVGRMNEIVDIVESRKMSSPAVIVIGEVVRRSSAAAIKQTFGEYNWRENYEALSHAG